MLVYGILLVDYSIERVFIMQLTQAIQDFFAKGNFTKEEVEYIACDIVEAGMKCGWSFETIEDIKKYYSDTEAQYCFVVYARDQKFSSELIQRILNFFEIEKKYDKCNLFVKTYPNGLVEVKQMEQLTFNQYCQKWLKNCKYGKSYLKNQILWINKKEELLKQWTNELLEIATKETLRTPVIMSFIRIYGESTLFNTFRGVYEMGVKNFRISKKIRDMRIN